MGSHLMQVLSFLIRELMTQQHSLLDPGRYSSRYDIVLKALPKGHKKKVFTLSQIFGSVQIIVSYPPEETCPELGPRLGQPLGLHMTDPPRLADSSTEKWAKGRMKACSNFPDVRHSCTTRHEFHYVSYLNLRPTG